MDCAAEILGVRSWKRAWMCSERVSGLFRREKMLPRKDSSGTMERVYGGRIGSLWPVPERALAGAGFAGFGYRGCLRCRAALYRTASCAGYTDCAGISCLLPAGAGRQLPLYNYDSECFIFDTMAESRTDTLPKPDVDFSSVLSL